MNCDCIEKVDKKLADAGYEYKISVSFLFDAKMNTEERLAVETYWSDPLKRRKKKPPSMLCTFCPFCGTRATKPDTATASALSTT